MGKVVRKVIRGFQRQVVYLPFADESECTGQLIADVKLEKDLMSQLKDEEILNITTYKHELYWWQLTQAFLFHTFIMFETNDWWWSVEKNDNGVFVQRSKHQWAVRDRLAGEKRPRVTQVASDTSTYTVRDFVVALAETDSLKRKYSLLFNNCKDFAKEIFDKVARTKFLHF